MMDNQRQMEMIPKRRLYWEFRLLGRTQCPQDHHESHLGPRKCAVPPRRWESVGRWKRVVLVILVVLVIIIVIIVIDIIVIIMMNMMVINLTWL